LIKFNRILTESSADTSFFERFENLSSFLGSKSGKFIV